MIVVRVPNFFNYQALFPFSATELAFGLPWRVYHEFGLRYLIIECTIFAIFLNIIVIIYALLTKHSMFTWW